MSPPPFDDWDRERILARRALFVTTAVAALGCSSQGGQSTPTSATTETSSRTSATATATATATAGTMPATKRRPWADVEKTTPPLSVGPSVPASEKEELESLAKRLGPHYAAVAKAWAAAPPSCAPKDCKDEWQAAAEAILEARDAVDEPGPCGEWGGIGLRQRRREQREHILAITKELEDALADASLAYGDATSWSRMVVRPPEPQPCLKCAPGQSPGILDNGRWGAPLGVGFADGKAELEKEALEALAKVKLEGEEAVIIRGHADPTEPDPTALAKKRAEAVRAQLIKNGINANLLTVLSIGSDLPIAASVDEEHKKRNRRVDFGFKKPK